MDSNHDILNFLTPLMENKGVVIEPEQFHDIVNIVFHNQEAKYYDSIHREMFTDLPMIFELLLDDYIEKVVLEGRKLVVLDVGCGTGLASDILLRSKLGGLIDRIDLIDTSSEMIRQCEETAKSWNVALNFIQGTIEKAPDRQYDLIVACSVLHHIPNLEMFLRSVDSLQCEGGIFFHVHDQNGDFVGSNEVRKRKEMLKKAKRSDISARLRRSKVLRMFERILENGKDREGKKSYIDGVNEELLRLGVINKPMTQDEIWSVTDVHVRGLPFSIGDGISLKRMKSYLKNYKLVSTRSYYFFGESLVRLPRKLKKVEVDLIKRGAEDGSQIGAMWQRYR